MKDIPVVGQYYHFWDDGKCSSSRHYICKCEKIIKLSKANNIMLDSVFFDSKVSLIKIWVNEKNTCDFLFAKETDVIVECSCPKYDENNLYFARTKDGGWFSMNIQSSWQGGRLDIDGEIYEEMKNYYELNNYDFSDYETQTY